MPRRLLKFLKLRDFEALAHLPRRLEYRADRPEQGTDQGEGGAALKLVVDEEDDQGRTHEAHVLHEVAGLAALLLRILDAPERVEEVGGRDEEQDQEDGCEVRPHPRATMRP